MGKVELKILRRAEKKSIITASLAPKNKITCYFKDTIVKQDLCCQISSLSFLIHSILELFCIIEMIKVYEFD